jgi:class II lanthipeptide synthase
MTDYRDQVMQALRAASVTSATTYAWFGRRSRPLPKPVVMAMSADATREYLVGLLGSELYRSFYTQGRPVLVDPDAARPDRPDDGFVEELSLANNGAGGWDGGWRVEKAARGILHVESNGLRVRVRASDCRLSRDTPAVGDAVSVRRAKELRAASPGFYTALGDRKLAMGYEGVEVRVYFNVAAAGAAPLVALCTRLLNEAELPFLLKVVDHPMGFSRCDTAVLYLDSDGFKGVQASLADAASVCASHLRPDAPAFTRPLTPGVAVGEHRPSLGASFGVSRCRLLAEGIVDAHQRGATRLEDRLDTVARRFARRGFNFEAPYLVPASANHNAL